MHKTAIYLGTFIGGITFTGSLTAFGKLQGLLSSNALNLPGKNAYNISMGLASVGAMGVFMTSPDMGTGMAMLGRCNISFIIVSCKEAITSKYLVCFMLLHDVLIKAYFEGNVIRCNDRLTMVFLSEILHKLELCLREADITWSLIAHYFVSLVAHASYLSAEASTSFVSFVAISMK